MFRDRDEALQELQAQLLEEEEQTAPEQEEDFLDEELLDKILTDTDQGESCGVYQNFSNDYGRNLRNYASGYKAYNADKTDVDPRELSDELFHRRKKTEGLLWAVLLVLVALIVGVIGWILLVVGGLF